MKVVQKLDAYQRLGIINLARVFFYLLRLKSGWLRKRLPIGKPVEGNFFQPVDTKQLAQLKAAAVTYEVPQECLLFGWYPLSLQEAPDWHRSVLTQKRVLSANKHWVEITDFNSGVGDIKGVWEASRFTWLLPFVFRALANQDPKELASMQKWLADWSRHNPVNRGSNWKCAQEASLRVLHLAATALLLEQNTPTKAMRTMLSQHLRRILPTLGYAKAQDNNHGTSEAAALFVGGSWLLQDRPADRFAKMCMQRGVSYLNERAQRLIMADGSFSQYSLTYHRMMLDSMSLCELWRRHLQLKPMAQSFIDRLKLATHWLVQMIDPITGDGPNLGANDGAHILNFSQTSYRDFRPSAELAAQLFCQQTAFSDPGSVRIRQLFDLKSDELLEQSSHQAMMQGGYGVLRNEQAMCMLRVPNFMFRPGQADALHLDFWQGGRNELVDGGSYSYNTDAKWQNYFPSVKAHNTIQFDDRDQMPKISRFLYGKWLSSYNFSIQSTGGALHMHAAYKDHQHATHERAVTLFDDRMVIEDKVSGFKNKACLRWRLGSADWHLDAHTASNGQIKVHVDSDESLIRCDLAQGHESRYYAQKHGIPVLEVEVARPATITTTISWT